VSNDLRNKLRAEIAKRGCGLRGVQALTGVSFSTISRFLRGADLLGSNLEKLEALCDGREVVIEPPVKIVRFSVSGKTFIMEIRELK